MLNKKKSRFSNYHASIEDSIDWDEPMCNGYFQYKYLVDRCLAACLLLALSPLILLLWLAVKATSRGTGFYTQARVGQHGKVFKVVKLRSMCSNAELDGQCKWSPKSDSRVTPLGSILRKLHLDELPQLWNVAKGEMSMVGPRPERPEEILLPSRN